MEVEDLAMVDLGEVKYTSVNDRLRRERGSVNAQWSCVHIYIYISGQTSKAVKTRTLFCFYGVNSTRSLFEINYSKY